MGMKISVCGKGGSGKSTVVSLLAFSASDRGLVPLVIDSDESNSGLYRLLGMGSPPTALMEMVGGKQELKEKIGKTSVLTEARIRLDRLPAEFRRQMNGLSLVSVGKIHQAKEGCACPMGVLSREFLTKLVLDSNEIALVDMEAGIEHLGRGIDCDLDYLALVVDPSFESILLAEKIKKITRGLDLVVGTIINKAAGPEMLGKVSEMLTSRNLNIIGSIPNDPAIFEAGLAGDPLYPRLSMDYGEKILDGILERR
jgi:CO dehydrogenase maturation factor